LKLPSDLTKCNQWKMLGKQLHQLIQALLRGLDPLVLLLLDLVSVIPVWFHHNFLVDKEFQWGH
jgi:hypothetical protein